MEDEQTPHLSRFHHRRVEGKCDRRGPQVVSFRGMGRSWSGAEGFDARGQNGGTD